MLIDVTLDAFCGNDGAVEISFGKRVADKGDRARGQSLTTPDWKNHVGQVDVPGANACKRLIGLSLLTVDTYR